MEAIWTIKFLDAKYFPSDGFADEVTATLILCTYQCKAGGGWGGQGMGWGFDCICWPQGRAFD